MLMLVLEDVAQMKIVKFFHKTFQSPAFVILFVSCSLTVVMTLKTLVVIVEGVRN